MLENKDFLNGKIKIGNVNHEISLPFDRVHKEWIQQLLLLIQKILNIQNRYALSSYQFGYNFIEQPEYSFLGTSCTAINQLLYVLIKDELSEATANFALPYLCKNISTGEFEIDYKFSLKYTERLLKDDFNSILAPYFFDTYVGMWSCFESAIISITKRYEALIKQELAESEFKKYKNLIKNILFVDVKDILPSDKIDKILEEKRADIMKRNTVYISFHDRTNYLFKQIREKYARNINKDKSTLIFLGALRNTVHNNGRHLKKDMEIELGGKLFCLRENEDIYFERFIDCIILFNELFDIYCEILQYVTQQKIIELSKV